MPSRVTEYAQRILELPGIRELHARNLLFPVALGLVVLGVLIHGAFNRDSNEGEAARLEIALPSIDVPSLRADLEKSPLTYVSDYWRQLTENVENKLVLLGPENVPGVVVAPGVALTTISAAHELLEREATDPGATPQRSQLPLEAGGQEPSAASQRLLGVDTELGLALFAIKQPESIKTFQSVPPGRMPPGSYVAAVSKTATGRMRITPGHVVSLQPALEGEPAGTRMDVSIPFPEDFEAAALVDLDGELAGVAVRIGGKMQVLSSDMIPSVVDRLAHGSICQAIEVADLSEEALARLGAATGVFVEHVVAEAFVPEPSIREGDILLNWDDRDVMSADLFGGLYAATEPGTLVRYKVRRNGKAVSGATRMPGPTCRAIVRPEATFERLGVTLDWQDSAWVVAHVTGESPAAVAGLERGDRIIAAEGREIKTKDLSPFRRFERSGTPMLLSVRQGDRVRMVLVEAASSQEGNTGSPE